MRPAEHVAGAAGRQRDDMMCVDMHGMPGGAMTVSAPLSTTTTPCSLGIALAVPMRSACTALVSVPASRLISAGCGVITTAWPQRCQSNPASATMFSASASTTAGHGRSDEHVEQRR